MNKFIYNIKILIIFLLYSIFLLTSFNNILFLLFQKELVFENNISMKTYFSSYNLFKNYFFKDID